MYAWSTFREKTINFSQQLNMTKRRHASFSALVQEKEESVKFALTFTFQKVIRSFAIKKTFFPRKELAQIDIQPLSLMPYRC